VHDAEGTLTDFALGDLGHALSALVILTFTIAWMLPNTPRFCVSQEVSTDLRAIGQAIDEFEDTASGFVATRTQPFADMD